MLLMCVRVALKHNFIGKYEGGTYEMQPVNKYIYSTKLYLSSN